MNQFRTLVRTDTRTIQDISKEIGVHYNTITRLIRADCELRINSKTLEAAQKLAALYGKRVVISITLEPVENDTNANS